ncbi:hypothetical protein HMPREF0063_10052 [Aeromicrobium marinum DSM 15272]|uniref:Uncharacterized protein n=1 Tax=Aeromicrobium marinum DSM 15272 TaxID=585531 RepID=E2S7P5_9ACTN|nr:hypothetical protein [Aeromicrobium marinum]EFQ84711.1 hypothetical protein HMPREF0063_10052 [Aeromicrobium marinum DSM 15272]
MSKSFADVMASEKNGRRRTTEQVCFSPDLAEEYQALGLEYMEARRSEEARAANRNPEKPKPTGRIAGDPASVNLLKQMAALVDENPDSFHEFVLQQSKRSDWNLLLSKHAPRDSKPQDAGRYNMDTFPPAALRLALVDPEPDDEMLAFCDEILSSGEWKRLASTIWHLNEGVRAVPKAEHLSLILAGSASA